MEHDLERSLNLNQHPRGGTMNIMRKPSINRGTTSAISAINASSVACLLLVFAAVGCGAAETAGSDSGAPVESGAGTTGRGGAGAGGRSAIASSAGGAGGGDATQGRAGTRSVGGANISNDAGTGGKNSPDSGGDVLTDAPSPDARDVVTDGPSAEARDAAGPKDAGSGDSPAIGADAGQALHVAIPLYIWPGQGTEWARVAAAGAAVSYVIANAGDPGGPGSASDSTYVTAIDRAHEAGQRVVGYVDTSYASRRLATVESEIDQWYAFYPAIDGIFLDLTPSEADRIADYYTPASNRVRAKPGAHVVIINPGQPDFDERYMALADIAMNYENPYGSASDGYAPGDYSAPSWANRYEAERFWHVILEVPDKTAMANVISLARTRNVGHVYITNYPDPPAYARLPDYFTDEVAAIAGALPH